MDKERCDTIICEYTKKLYGFAVSKTRSIERAEELASRITLEVYTSLLRRDDVDNVNAYIYRIAQNVWARFTDEYKRMHCDIDTVDIMDTDDFTERLIDSETYAKLRCEIAYLSETRRKILVLHYYENKKLSEIAAQLSLPVGTVKWHLNGARNELKERLDIMRNIGKLGLNPIQLTNLGHDGMPGTRGDTSDFLARRLTQNIAYAAYHQSRTISEIADELGLSPIFVADEVSVLEEYGFMDKIGEKFRTNIFISEPTKEWDAQAHTLLSECAAKLCEIYVPRVIDSLNAFDRSGVYVPDGDENLWLWSGITWALGNIKVEKKYNASQFCVPRKDGGCYIASASLGNNFTPDYDASKYFAAGNMNRGSDKYPICSWQLRSCYDPRPTSWKDNLYTDYEWLYEFITGKISKQPESIEKYQRLRDLGYLREDDTINIICIRDTARYTRETAFQAAMPKEDEALKRYAADFADALYALDAPHYPEHMRPLCRAYSECYISSNSVRMRVLERLLADGILRLPTPEQAGGMTTLLFTDVLPE